LISICTVTQKLKALQKGLKELGICVHSQRRFRKAICISVG
jgi:hypothetical protein